MSTLSPLGRSEIEDPPDQQKNGNGGDRPISPLALPHSGKLRKIPPILHHGVRRLNDSIESGGSDEEEWKEGPYSSPIVASSLGLNQIRTRFSASPLQSSSSAETPSVADGTKTAKLQQLPTQSGRVIPHLIHAKSLKFPPNFTPGLENYHAAFAKEIQSPRFQAIMRLTSGRKKNARDIKSFSHELSSKGVRPYPYWKPRAAGHMEEIVAVIKAKFDRLKEEVNADLAVFAGDLVGILEDSSTTHPEWKEILEDLLVIARHCATMSAKEFWFQCEGIVQKLDDRRQDLPARTLKQAHTRILFILTRCSRLVQFQKESDHEEDLALGLQHLSQLEILSEHINNVGFQSFDVGQKVHTEKIDESCDLNQTGLERKQNPLTEIVSSANDDDEVGTATSIASTASSYRMSSWKKLPSPIAKCRKGGSDVVSSTSNVNSHTFQVKDEERTALHDNNCRINIPACPIPDVSATMRKVSWGPLINQNIMIAESSMICRICELEIPTLYVEEHSKICTIVDRCDLKGLTVNHRIERVAETLEKIFVSWMPKADNDGRSPEELSPRHNDSSSRSSEELEYPHEADSSFGMDDLNVSAYLLSQSRSIVPDLVKESSISGSLTPRSPLLASRTNQIELLLSGHAIINNDDRRQILKLLGIAHSVADANESDNTTLEFLLECLEELKYVLQTRKVDALVVDTFGKRIEKLLQEKYVQLCGQMEEDKFDSTTVIADDDSSVEDDTVHSLRASPVRRSCKDRTSIEDFEIIKPISRGAYGRVFLARKRTTGDLFAIKVLKKVDMIRKNAVDSILAERNILISARNPFVVGFFYSFTCRENLYLVMEYLNGGDLYSLMKNLGCLDEDMARVYVAEIVLALEYLHSLNVIHRDLKPDNLLIGPDGHIKLTDFGLSKVGLINSTDELSGSSVSSSISLTEGPSITPKHSSRREHPQKHVAVGTPDYLAPEILLGMGHGSTADWWSVGIILFELLVGVPPFNAQNPQQIFDNIMNRDIPWPKIPDELSYEAYDLIDKLLSENPVQRLGATGAGEVKRHPFFNGINWETVARQKATFIPSLEGIEDTSYFMSRWISNWEDEFGRGSDMDATTESCSLSCSSGSLANLQDEYGDECGNMTVFGSPPTVKYSFSNFSFKNLSQLASINYDLLLKNCKESPDTSKSLLDSAAQGCGGSTTERS